MGYVWIVISILFLFAEVTTPGLFFFISFAVGALCAAIISFFGYSIVAQCLFGLFSSSVVFLILRKYLKQKKMSEVFYGDANTNIYGLIGKKCVVIEKITAQKAGRVKIGGELWRARSKDDIVLENNAIVTVLKLQGNTVIVASDSEQKK